MEKMENKQGGLRLRIFFNVPIHRGCIPYIPLSMRNAKKAIWLHVFEAGRSYYVGYRYDSPARDCQWVFGGPRVDYAQPGDQICASSLKRMSKNAYGRLRWNLWLFESLEVCMRHPTAAGAASGQRAYEESFDVISLYWAGLLLLAAPMDPSISRILLDGAERSGWGTYHN